MVFNSWKTDDLEMFTSLTFSVGINVITSPGQREVSFYFGDQ